RTALAWLFEGSGLSLEEVEAALPEGKSIADFKLEDLGLVVLRLVGLNPKVLAERGEGLEGKARQYLDSVKDGKPEDLASALASLLKEYNRQMDEEINLETIGAKVLEQVTRAITEELPEAFAGFLRDALLLGSPKGLVKLVQAFLGPAAKRVADLVGALTEAAEAARHSAARVAGIVKDAARRLLVAVLELAAALLEPLMRFVNGVRKAFAAAVDKLRELGAYLLSWLDWSGTVRSKHGRVKVRLVRRKGKEPLLEVEMSPGHSLQDAVQALSTCPASGGK